MKKAFIKRVIREGIVDTRKYRYMEKTRYGLTEQWIEVLRLPVASLDTTAAIDGWAVVYDSRTGDAPTATIHMGLYSYQITGDKAQEAAADLERRLDAISRDYRNPYTADDMSAARRTVADQYGVEIRAVV